MTYLWTFFEGFSETMETQLYNRIILYTCMFCRHMKCVSNTIFWNSILNISNIRDYCQKDLRFKLLNVIRFTKNYSHVIRWSTSRLSPPLHWTKNSFILTVHYELIWCIFTNQRSVFREKQSHLIENPYNTFLCVLLFWIEINARFFCILTLVFYNVLF